MTTKVTPRQTLKVRVETAHYLVLRYAPGAELQVQRGTATPEVRVGEAESADPNLIVWAPRDGLTSLLHEIAHHRLEGHAPPGVGAEVVLEEMRAWEWAEWCAREENVFFDYAYARRAIGCHTHNYTKETGRRCPVQIQWRWQ